MSVTPLYRLADIARQLNLPESTIRYYRDAFAAHVPTVGSGRRRRYPAEAFAVLHFIAQAYATGRSRAEIEAGLPPPGDVAPSTIPTGLPSPALPAVRDTLAAALIEGERERNEFMWRIAEEMTRLGTAIERQQHVLSELVSQLIDGHRTRTTGQDEDGATVLQAAVVEPDTAGSAGDGSNGSDWETIDEEVAELRRALRSERELVERLRRSKLELEQRAVAAEAELERTLDRLPRGLWQRLFGREDDMGNDEADRAHG